MIMNHIVTNCHELSAEVKMKTPLSSHLIVEDPLSGNSHFIMKRPADNGEDDKYFSIWSKRGIKTCVFTCGPSTVHLAPNCFQETARTGAQSICALCQSSAQVYTAALC